ncbi:MAG: endolytic transglycosylase MltG [Chloroflexota bacterium]
MEPIGRSHRRPQRKRSPLSCLVSSALLAGAIGGIAIAGLVLLDQVRFEGGASIIELGDETVTRAPDTGLSTAERAFLRGVLTLRSAELERPAGGDNSPIEFTVNAGENATSIASRLASLGLLTDSELFLYYLRYYGLDQGLEAGEFMLQSSMTIPEIAHALSHATANELTFRVTEGWRYTQIAEFADQLSEDVVFDEFIALTSQQTMYQQSFPEHQFIQDIPEGQSLEGYLFPDTYRLPSDASAVDIVSTMLSNFNHQITEDILQGLSSKGLSLHQGLTLASIVEREAQLATERPVIASVFFNRLNIGMKLDADPTVQYALGYQVDTGEWWKRPLYLVDLEVDSPYNTYKNPGLPPGPIASPSLASIEAVAFAPETDFLYFVVDCTAETPGTHVFSTTFEEHQANVSKCQ